MALLSARHLLAVSPEESAAERPRHVALSPGFPLGTPWRRSSDATTAAVIEGVRGDEPELATKLRIEERKLEADVRN